MRNHSVIGREFCIFLSALFTFKLINKFYSLKELEDLTYGNVMDILAMEKKIKINSSWELIRMNVGQVDVLRALGIHTPAPEEESSRPAKRGRPAKKMI